MEIYTCDKCGYIEPYFHEDGIVTCDCKIPPVKIEDVLKRVINEKDIKLRE